MLITRFMTPDGVGEVLDFMPVIEGKPTDRHRLVRHLRVARGTMEFVMDLQPRFDYGRAKHTIEASEGGAVFRSDNGMELTLHSTGKRRSAEAGPPWSAPGRPARHVHYARRRKRARGRAGVDGRFAEDAVPAELDRLAEDTEAYWKGWLGRSAYTGRWREMVDRSAMTLKLMTYEPTGAPVAAARSACPSKPAASGTGTTGSPGSGTAP